jgi:hypothetical protein
MRHLEAGTKVPGGFYFDTDGWKLVTVNGRKGVLPGDGKARWMRVPALLVLAGAPVLGGAFVLFLPFIGFALFARHLAANAKERLAAAEPAKANVRAR